MNVNGSLSQFLADRFSEVSEQIAVRLFSELEEAAAAAGAKSRRAANEAMNQTLRRLRQCESTDEVAAWLVDATLPFASQAALFEIKPTTLRGVRSRGFDVENEWLEELEIALDRAPALAQSAQQRDTVVAIGSPSEVSPEIVATLGHSPDEKVYLYPIVMETKAVAVLYATASGAAGHQFVDGAALELLTQAAASAIQILSHGATPQTRRKIDDLVSIEGAQTPSKRPSDQAILREAREARARLFARSAVARIRLKKKDLIEKSRGKGDLYKTLKPEIDAARQAYRHEFLAVSPVIADYLNNELILLAQNDASLLGPDYPGSLV